MRGEFFAGLDDCREFLGWPTYGFAPVAGQGCDLPETFRLGFCESYNLQNPFDFDQFLHGQIVQVALSLWFVFFPVGERHSDPADLGSARLQTTHDPSPRPAENIIQFSNVFCYPPHCALTRDL